MEEFMRKLSNTRDVPRGAEGGVFVEQGSKLGRALLCFSAYL